MLSPAVQESRHPQETSYRPVLNATQFNRGLDGWHETCWFVKHEEDELAGYLFNDDSDARREGAD